MIEYLESEEFKERNDAKTTISSVPLLLQINKAGMITTNSQEGLVYSGYNKDTKKYYMIKERAYVEGIMKQKDAFLFVKKINEMTDKIAFIVRNDPSKEYKKVYASSAEIPTIQVTVAGTSSKSIKDIQDFSSFTSIPLSLPSVTFSKEYKEISEKVENVVIVDPQYGRKATSKNGLYNEILNKLN